MVLTTGLAFAVICRLNVPAKDTLAILWGNLFALTGADLWLTLGFAAASLLFVLLMFNWLEAVPYSRKSRLHGGRERGPPLSRDSRPDRADRSVRCQAHRCSPVGRRAAAPAIVSSFFARSTRQMSLYACLTGFGCSLAGFFVSVFLDIPASSAVTIVAAMALGTGLVLRGKTV